MRDRDTWYGKLIDDVKTSVSAPDFWQTLAVFAAVLIVFILFFWMALGFDMMTRIYGHWRGACRKLGDWQSFVLFVSPLAICMSSLLAAGEFISQLERRNRFKRPIQWSKIGMTFGFAIGLLSTVVTLMAVWC